MRCLSALQTCPSKMSYCRMLSNIHTCTYSAFSMHKKRKREWQVTAAKWETKNNIQWGSVVSVHKCNTNIIFNDNVNMYLLQRCFSKPSYGCTNHFPNRTKSRDSKHRSIKLWRALKRRDRHSYDKPLSHDPCSLSVINDNKSSVIYMINKTKEYSSRYYWM